MKRLLVAVVLAVVGGCELGGGVIPTMNDLASPPDMVVAPDLVIAPDLLPPHPCGVGYELLLNGDPDFQNPEIEGMPFARFSGSVVPWSCTERSFIRDSPGIVVIGVSITARDVGMNCAKAMVLREIRLSPCGTSLRASGATWVLYSGDDDACGEVARGQYPMSCLPPDGEFCASGACDWVFDLTPIGGLRIAPESAPGGSAKAQLWLVVTLPEGEPKEGNINLQVGHKVQFRLGSETKTYVTDELTDLQLVVFPRQF